MLRYLRRNKSLTLKELAKKAGGLSLAFLSNLETGKTDASLGTLRRIAKALGVTICDLLEEPSSNRRRSSVTYKRIYEVSQNESWSISKRQAKLEGLFNGLVCEIRDKPPRNKTQSDGYWHKLTEISREICRVRERR